MLKLYVSGNNIPLDREECINIQLKKNEELTPKQLESIQLLLTKFYDSSILVNEKSKFETKIEIGPRLTFCTPWCSNALEILSNTGINNIERIEKSFIFNDLDKANSFIDLMTQMKYDNIDTFDIEKKTDDSFSVDVKDLDYYNETLGLSFDKDDIEYYKTIFKHLTNVELYDLAQSNSEHSRHWIFNGNYTIKDKINFVDDKSMFQRIKSTNDKSTNSLNAFSDNASAIEGYNIDLLMKQQDENTYELFTANICPTHTAETHNFPTGVCPFPGASTGTGGRIRDSIAIGKGGNIISGYVGYSVGNINPNKFNNYEYPYENPTNILIKASNGASDYGNKIGEPVILGYTRSFSIDKNDKRIEYVKPIMYCGGIGSILKHNINKDTPSLGLLVVRVGGPAYCIGLGGGAASSRNQDKKNKSLDFDAVQRGDPQMENKVCRFIKSCSELNPNPIVSIHDQGSGGMGNVTKEIVEPNGAIISLNNVKLGDKTMSSNEIWNAEYQEQVSILIYPKDKDLIKQIAKRECVNLDFAGVITNSGRIEVFNKNDSINKVVDFDLEKVLNKIPIKNYLFNVVKEDDNCDNFYCDPIKINDYVKDVLNHVSVGSKRFLTNKVDRSVTGLIAQQQCIGPFHTPLSNYSITAFSVEDTRGIATSIGEQPIKGLVNTRSLVEMTIAEMLTNLMFVSVSDFKEIKCLGNWMWSPKLYGEGYKLYEAVKYVESTLKKLEIGIDGGKDSLSMNTKIKDKVVMSPNTLVMSSYVLCPDITCKATPDFKKEGSNIIFIDLSYYHYNLGGSIFAQTLNQVGSKAPEFRNIDNFPKIFNYIQKLLKENKILAGHDRSDGGLISTIVEMCISSYVGCELSIKSDVDYISYLFNEELGLIIEVENRYLEEIIENMNNYCPTIKIGETTKERNIIIKYNYETIIENDVIYFWKQWEHSSYMLEKKQCSLKLVEEEYNLIDTRIVPYSIVNEEILKLIEVPSYIEQSLPIYNVGILREVGSNGDKEMASAFYDAGFNVFDITMTDLLENNNLLKNLNIRGLAFVGGFSYSDVFGAGVGWASNIKSNLKEQFLDFYLSNGTFSLGVCNGCQVMSLLGILPKVRFVENDSKRFESRWSQIKVSNSNCIFTKGLEQTVFGMWTAHGEGKFVIDDDNVNKNLYALHYVDDCGNITQKYPFNPNGSQDGVAGICSENGRHLALMPHPERCFLKWQCPYIHPEVNKKLGIYTPWFGLFKNAYKFCRE